MSLTTVFLSRPAGVRITSNEPPIGLADANPQKWLLLDSITLVNQRGARVTIPTENIASIEVVD